MKLNAFSLSAAFSILASMPAQAASYCPPRPASPSEQRQIFQEFYQKLYVDINATQAMLDHAAEDYIQHNPYALSGRDNSIEALSFVTPETVKFNVTFSGIDGDLAFIYLRMDVAGTPRPNAVVDLFRFNGSCKDEVTVQSWQQKGWSLIDQNPSSRSSPPRP